MRNFPYLLFVLMICLTIRAFGQDFYSQIERAYGEGRLPETSEVMGYWIGRCVRVEEKAQLLPGIFIHKLVNDEGKFPPNYLSMTSYFENGASTKFDKYTPQDILQDPKVSDWLSREQWTAVSTSEQAVTNVYNLEKGRYLHRGVKLYQSDFENILILRVVEIQEESRETFHRHYCYFNRRVGTIHPELYFGFTGPVEDQIVEFANRYPEADLKHIWVKNHGSETIKVRDFQWWSPKGSSAFLSSEFTLKPNGSFRVWLDGEDSFKVSRLSFTVIGKSENLFLDAEPLR